MHLPIRQTPSIKFDIQLEGSTLLMKNASYCCGSDYAVSVWLSPQAPPFTTSFQSAMEPHKVDTWQTRQAWLNQGLRIEETHITFL